MKVVSLSVGLPREVEWDGHTVLTSIFKEPVDRRLRVSTLNFEGDQQSDLTVHGGLAKAVYAYPAEHYESGAASSLEWSSPGPSSART